MDEEKTALIEATRGPYAGSRLTVSEAEAKQAIADGWAVDPFAPPKADHVEGEDYNDPTEEQIVAAVAAAEKAARRLRGETEPKEGKAPPKKHPEPMTDDAVSAASKSPEPSAASANKSKK